MMDMTKYAGSESKYLKAEDLKGGRPQVVIDSVELLEFETDDGNKTFKPAVGLRGKEKKLVLNATNTNEIIGVFGPDSEGWIGKTLQLTTKHYPAFGRDGIVVMAINTEGLDDDIPF
jgi:hypothetical protein